MGAYTITLDATEEVGLLALVERYQLESPERNWTPLLVLEDALRSNLASEIRQLDRQLQPLVDVGRRVPAAIRGQIVVAMGGARQARLQQLLP